MVRVTSATSTLQDRPESADRRVETFGRLPRGRLQPGVLAFRPGQRGTQLGIRPAAPFGPGGNRLVEPVERRFEPLRSLVKS